MSFRVRLSLLLTLAALALAAAPLAPAGTASAASAHASSTFLTGIGDEESQMFSDPLWEQLHTKIARYIAPYDAVVHSDSLARARAWIKAAEAQHIQILVAFYHSEHTPTRMPSVASYRHDVQKFIRMFPNVRQYQSWDEANRGNIRRVLSSPSANAAAKYYQALIGVCNGCTAIGLDILDQQNISSSLRYISEFKREVRRLHTTMPKIWGLHNYSDVNRFQSWRTRDFIRAFGGQVWLTETGGIVKFGGAFPNVKGRGLTRAAKVVTYTMNLVPRLASHIKRIYLYNWTGGTASSRFDAGLTDAHHNPRAGYVSLCRILHVNHCSVKVSPH